jgi:rhamnose utilization protein RhaD (predicted bifunctional aldolase and dehydrogenase)/NAD(P)-dependent dehydrogenase (short-subunit alcohol dehydrogenase family)
MKNLWNNAEAAAFEKNPLELRVYTSRLLGSDPALVLHGGGNTSVKIKNKNFFGDIENLIYVKGSGWDLATIEAKGFAPVRLETLLRLAKLPKLSDTDMVNVQKSAMTDPSAPGPSVEAILHALIPFDYVDHTHADAVVAITNTAQGEKFIHQVYGDSVLYIPYVMPGFLLAQKVYQLTRDIDWKKYQGMILMNHGIFTFSDSASESYQRMINLVQKAEDFIKEKNAFNISLSAKLATEIESVPASEDLLTLATLRREVSKKMGLAVVARLNLSKEAAHYSALENISQISQQGPLTPDHVIHTKRIPLLLKKTEGAKAMASAIENYESDYREYYNKFASNSSEKLKCLDPAPRWAIWPQRGVISFGVNVKRADVVADIVNHTMRAQQWSEHLGGWVALPNKDIFEVEYWELEQSKLTKGSGSAKGAQSLSGKVAIVTGAASGIGKACVDRLLADGAAVVAVDINPAVKKNWNTTSVLSIVCDLTKSDSVDKLVASTIAQFGGLDIVVANAGIFPASSTINNLDNTTWNRTLDINLNSQMYLFRAVTPYLVLGIDPTLIVIASKNVTAPGPGAAAYSVSKAGTTQLARVAALELGPLGVRVNMLHPHAVMDTALWTPEILASRASHYKMTVEEYKCNNLLKVEVSTTDVANLVVAMAGPLFAKTTGAQIAVDGGSDRII